MGDDLSSLSDSSFDNNAVCSGDNAAGVTYSPSSKGQDSGTPPGPSTTGHTTTERAQAKRKLEAGDLKGQQDGGMSSSKVMNTEGKETQELCERTRNDCSLVFLTQKFVQLVQSSADGVLDLNVASSLLNIPKRRVYDVTNALEGICLLKKKSKNYVEWLGGQGSTIREKQLTALIQEEMKLDELIQCCTRQIHQMCEDRLSWRFAYLTYEDVQKIPSLKEQTVILIKAPAETKLVVPHPEESLQVHLSSTQGPIEVFVCADKSISMDGCDCLTNTSTDEDNSILPMPSSSTVQVSSKDNANHDTGITTMSIQRYEPTQHSSPVSVTPSPPPLATSEDQQSFVTLSPPLSFSLDAEEYLLSLAKDEGITDLFSAVDLDQLPLDIV